MKNTIKSLFIAGLVALTASCDIVNFDKPGSKFDELCFTCTSGNVAIAMTKKTYSKTMTAPDISLLYSKDKTSWLDLKIGDGKGGVTDSTSITLAPGEKVYFKAKTTNDGLAEGSIAFNIFTTTSADNGKVDVSGNIMTLLDGNNPGTTLSPKGAFTSLFRECKAIQNASGLYLPATTLQDYCYAVMFYNCTALTTAPALPATTLANNCYQSMFYLCSALTTAPALPATTLTNFCYCNMFTYCKALTTAPALPATKLAEKCYYNMFFNCTALTTAPALPATTLIESCYESMFSGCSALITAPTLPATKLEKNCYYKVFENCSKLPSVTMLATDVSATDCLNNWLRNAGTEAGTHTLYVDPTMTGNATISASKGNFTVAAYSGN